MLKIDGNLFKDAVSGVAKSAKRSRLAQSFVFVAASNKDNKVTFSVVGETIQLEKSVSADVTKSFVFTTTVQELEFKASVIPDDVELTVEALPTNVFIRWGRASQMVLLINPETAPVIEFPDVITSVTLPQGKIHQISRLFGGFPALINSAVAKEHPILTSIAFEKTDTEEVIIQATNSIRAIRHVDCFDWFAGLQAGIPAEALNSLTEVIEPSVTVNVSLAENQNLLVFEAGSVKAIVRLVNGKFPDTSGVYSDETAAIVWRVDRMELLQIARRIKRLGEKPIMQVVPNGAKVFAKLEGVLQEQIGAVSETSICEGFSINAEYVELALSSLRGEEVLIAFKSSKSPVTFLSGDEESAEKLTIMAAQFDLAKVETA